jgi:hypothetical protein
MASSVADFKAHARREFTLPHSKLTVAVRMITCSAFLGLGELPIPAVPEDLGGNGHGQSTPEATDARLKMLEVNLAYADRAIVMAAIEPRISNKDEDRDRADVVHIEDLSQPDRLWLGNLILDMIGLNVTTAEQVQSFREDAERPAREGVSGAVSQAPA